VILINIVVQKMEHLDRTYRARFFSVVIAVFCALLILMVGAVLLSTLLGGQGSTLSLMIGSATMIFGLVLIICGIFILFSQLRVFSTSHKFTIRVNLYRWMLWRVESEGVSWHAVAYPLSSYEGGGDFTLYHIEVCDFEGDRHIVLGSFLCWIYGVSCL